MSQEIKSKCKNKESWGVWSISVGQGSYVPQQPQGRLQLAIHKWCCPHIDDMKSRGIILNYVAYSLLNNMEVWCLASAGFIFPRNQQLVLQFKVEASGRDVQRHYLGREPQLLYPGLAVSYSMHGGEELALEISARPLGSCWQPHQNTLIPYFICHFGFVIWGQGITKHKK